MSYIDKLLQGQEVQWKALGEVCDVLRGRRLTKRELSDTGHFPVFHGGIEPIGYYEKNNREAYSAMIINVGASAGTIGFSNKEFWSSDGCYCFSHTEEINQRFLYYALQTIETSIKSKVRVAGIPTLDRREVERIHIPIPSLSVQEKIVEILDKFTELEAELEAELDCRKRQYAYYRTHLLDFSDEMLKSAKGGGNLVQWKSLGEVCDVKNGFAFKSSLFQTTGLPIIRIGNIVETSINIDDVKYFDKQDYKRGNPLDYYIEKGDILIAMSGATTGKIGYYNHNEIAYQNQRVGKFIPQKDILNNRFLFHFLLTQSTFLYNLGGGGAQPNLSASDIKNKLIIPVPPMSVQEKIVKILDKFDTLTNSITEGLPKEIELRRKQYEYYREQLLSF